MTEVQIRKEIEIDLTKTTFAVLFHQNPAADRIERNVLRNYGVIFVTNHSFDFK